MAASNAEDNKSSSNSDTPKKSRLSPLERFDNPLLALADEAPVESERKPAPEVLAALAPSSRPTPHRRRTARPAPPPRPAGRGLRAYITAHWRGEQSLLRSFWVNNTLMAVPLSMAVSAVMAWISLKGQSLQLSSLLVLIGWPLTLLLNTWCGVGAWRAATAYLQQGGALLWGWLARLVLGLGLLQTLASLLLGFLPQAGGYLQMARGIDPIGRASYQLSADGRTLRLSGPIGMGDGRRLQQLLAGAPQVRLFELASPGGRVYEAERMVALLRERGADTRAVGGCESACTLVFLAGTQRQLMPGARLGFHRASSGTFNPAIDELANQQLAGSYRAMQLPEYFIERALRTPPHSMWYPKSEELVDQSVIAAPPQTLDIALPAGTPGGEPAPLADYVGALRSNAAWYALDGRFPELLNNAAARMRAVPATEPAETAQDAALAVLAPQVRELLLAGTPEMRRRYLAIVRAQLGALLQTQGAAICQNWLAGSPAPRRQLPAALGARETAWLITATNDPPARWLPRPPSALELEVVQRLLGAQAPGLLTGLWSASTPDGHAARATPDCTRTAQLLDRITRLPVAQRELVERVVFQQPRG